MSEARVYVNGKEVCFWPYGYNAFHCDVTDYVHPGENELAVRLENLPQPSRWYPGAGLYRNVHLIQTSDVHVPVWGTYITTPDVCADYASSVFFLYLTENGYISRNFVFMRKVTVLFISFLMAVFTAAAQTGTWSGNIDINGIQLPVVFHLDSDNPTMDSPDQGVKGIPVEVERTSIGGMNIKIPSIGASFNGFYLVKKIVGTFIQAGKEFPLTLVPGENRPRRPQTPVGPFPYEQEEVSFSNGSAVLRGTLVLPQGWNSNTPVLLMVTGSGLQNRDEEIFDHKPFAVIADALARSGIATLRYDDRGIGESSGDIINHTIEDLKNDASAGIGFLKERFEKVGVLGHSEGGTIALILAVEGKADFIVSLAGAVSMSETLLWQNRAALIASGYQEGTADAYCGLLGEAFKACIEGTPLPSVEYKDIPNDLKRNYQAVARQLKVPYMSSMVKVDLRHSLASVTCPVLALNGEKDTQVNPQTNLDAFRTFLPGNQKNCILQMEGLNHLFQHCTTGSFSEYKIIEETFAPEAIEVIVQWIRTIFYDTIVCHIGPQSRYPVHTVAGFPFDCDRSVSIGNCKMMRPPYFPSSVMVYREMMSFNGMFRHSEAMKDRATLKNFRYLARN